MVDNFSKRIEKAKQEGEAKLKIIAPGFTVPKKIASKKELKRRSSRGGSSSGQKKSISSLPVSSAPELQSMPRTPVDSIKKGGASISEQVSADPGTIDKFSPSKSFRRGKLETAGAFFQETGRDIGIIGKGVFLGRDIEGLRDPFNVFTEAGRQKGETPVFIPAFGTVTPETKSGVRRSTLFQEQRLSQSEAGVPLELQGLSPQAQAAGLQNTAIKDLTKQFQGKVDTGELTVDEAQSQASQAFNTRFARDTGQLQQLGGDLTKRSGETFGDVGRSVAITAGLVGGSVVSPTFAAGLGATSLAAAGQLSVRSGEEFSRGEFGKSAASFGQAGLFAASGSSLVAGSLGPSGSIPRSIDRLRIQELNAQPIRTLGLEATEGKDALTLLAGKRAVPSATQDLKLVIPTLETGVTKGGATKFTIGGGRGVSTTRLSSFGLEGIVPSGKEIITSSQALSFTARGTSGLQASLSSPQIKTQLGKGVSGSFGRLDVVTGDRVRRSVFGGISKTDNNIINVVSGRGSAGRVSVDQVGLLSNPSLLVKPGSFGKILKVNIKDVGAKGTGIKSFVGSGGKGIGGLSGLQQSTQAQGFGGQAGLKLTEIIKPTPVVRGSSSLKLSSVPVILGGTATSRFAGSGQDISPQLFSSRLQPSQQSLTPLTTEPLVPKLDNLIRTAPLAQASRGGKTQNRVIQRTIQAPVLSLIQAPAQGLIQAPAQGLKLAQKNALALRQASSSIFSPGISSRFPTAAIASGGGSGFGFPDIGFVNLGFGGGSSRPSFKFPGKIAPSLTGIAQFQIGGITGGPLPTIKETGLIGLSPGQLRLVPKKRKAKKKKK